MTKLFVPNGLEVSHPHLHRLALMQRTQKAADRFIRVARPDWSWQSLDDRVRGVRGDIKAASEHSLRVSHPRGWR